MEITVMLAMYRDAWLVKYDSTDSDGPFYWIKEFDTAEEAMSHASQVAIESKNFATITVYPTR